jgi:hypothetical protein
VLWFNNEEDSNQVRRRIYQAYLGWTNKYIAENTEQANQRAQEIKGRFKVIDAHALSIKDCEDIIKQHNAKVLIFDQLRKLKDSAEGLDKTQKLFYSARQLAIKYAPVVSIHQASDRAEGQMWVPDTELYGVRTEAQGELDIQIMMGATDKKSRQRGFNIVKNKGTRGGRAEEVFRHAQFVVEINPEQARYKDTETFN